MKFGWIECGSAAALVALALLAGNRSQAADQDGVRTVAEELGSRTRTAEAPADAPKDKLSDSAVRVMSTFALSILPDQIPDEKGQMVKIDKSNPNLYLIPIDDARHIIRVATRSAYAEVCNLLELEKANYNTLMRTEEVRDVWTQQQMMFIRALHTFATSYFAGNVKITEQPADDASANAKDGVAAADAANGESKTITSKKLVCTDEQRAKVTQAITAYVATGPKAPPAAAAAPQAAPAAPAPVAGGAN
jgi:hypothetical protein